MPALNKLYQDIYLNSRLYKTHIKHRNRFIVPIILIFWIFFFIISFGIISIDFKVKRLIRIRNFSER
jgi:hypothetical protein